MEFVSKYVAHQPDPQGCVEYSDEENTVWRTLYARQAKILPGRACDEFLEGLRALGLQQTAIPQLPEVNATLQSLTGWRVVPVEALISARDFFELLAKRCFPAATFIRTMEELDYVQEPDVFHELFGHCPLLCNPTYADFIHNYAQRVLSYPEEQWPLLQRMFWFTVEFGLIMTKKGLRAYGGGILSSIGETPYCIDSDTPMRILFNPITAFRTPYRIDMKQPIYFVIESFEQLYNFVQQDIQALMQKARSLGEYPPCFPVEGASPNIHIRAC